MGKTTEIAQQISQHIAQACQCQYSGNFIVNSEHFCTTDKTATVYQAKLLTTDGRTALDIRNITQLWVLSKPLITIDGRAYQVDPYCSVVVKELGVSSCDSNTSTESLSTDQPSVSVIELVSVIGMAALLILVVTTAIVLVLCCICRRKHKSRRYDIR